MGVIQILLLFPLSVITRFPFNHKVGYCASSFVACACQGWCEGQLGVSCGCWSLRQIGRSFWSTSTGPMCVVLATAVTFFGPRRTPRCCTLELRANCATSRSLGTRHWSREVFRSNSTAALGRGRAGVEVGAPCWALWTFSAGA